MHQWFGCAVSPDFERGNWCEGLATYFSDHLQAEGKNTAWIYRRQLLAEFQKQQPKIMEFSLRDFTVGVGPPSRAVGYGKGTLVFHMLRRQVGDQAFASRYQTVFHYPPIYRGFLDRHARIFRKSDRPKLILVFSAMGGGGRTAPTHHQRGQGPKSERRLCR